MDPTAILSIEKETSSVDELDVIVLVSAGTLLERIRSPVVGAQFVNRRLFDWHRPPLTTLSATLTGESGVFRQPDGLHLFEQLSLARTFVSPNIV
jgi:hypothetical protein